MIVTVNIGTKREAQVDVKDNMLSRMTCTAANRIRTALSEAEIKKAFLIPLLAEEVPNASIVYPYIYRDGDDIARETTDGWYAARRHPPTKEALKIVGQRGPEKISHLYSRGPGEITYWASMSWTLSLNHPMIRLLNPPDAIVASGYGTRAESIANTMGALLEIVEGYDLMVSYMLLGEYGDYSYQHLQLCKNMRSAEDVFCPAGHIPNFLGAEEMHKWLSLWRVPVAPELRVQGEYRRMDAYTGRCGAASNR
jgi:hypothetical protein